MYQATLFGYDHLSQVVNVASVPQRSPFRYPGGKTWLVPRIRHWLNPAVREQLGIAPSRPVEFIEPFAGGGIVSLTVAAEHLARHVTMVEIDQDIAAVWQTILDETGAEWLVHQILHFDLTLEHVVGLLNTPPASTAERAFQTIVKNRVYHGGILAPGSGLIKYGEAGRGIRSRWYPETLARRILAITAMRDRMTFLHGDGLEVLGTYTNRTDLAVFIDPPYTIRGNGKRAGRRLYTHCELDHDSLFALAGQLQGDFLMTYDDATEVRALATSHGFATKLIAMKNTHHAKMSELLVGPNLSWVAQSAEAFSDTAETIEDAG
ncbi:MAG: DNA adenine methylase [Ktedonobacterales bacterium]